MGIYVSRYPPEFNLTYVKATSYYSANYMPHMAFDPNISLIGTDVNKIWCSTDSALPQKLNIDYGTPIVFNRVLIDNYHYNGSMTEYGLNNIRIYGTNSSTAFDNLDGTNTVDLTLLKETPVRIHVSQNIIDTESIDITNDIAYRYMVIIVLDRIPPITTTRIAVRRIVFQHYNSEGILTVVPSGEKNSIDRAIPHVQSKNAKINALQSWKETLLRSVTAYRPLKVSSTNHSTIFIPPPVKVVEVEKSNRHHTAYWSYHLKTPRLNFPFDDPLIDTSGSITGVVKVEGILTEGIPVSLIFKPNNLEIGRCTTDSKGRFRFDYLEFNKDFYTVIAHKEGYNAAVKDSVRPVKTIY